MKKQDQEKLDELLTKIINENIDVVIADRFSRYSKYIIQQRALPDVRDGLKPVQRRILYSMSELGLQNNKPFKKSARVVGDVIGKYHPHGDSSIYEAMVRMSQDWKMGIPLLQMHGNIGSIDDDPAAAMRYTEVRLAKIADLMLSDLKKNTVAFAPNFDDSEQEPTVLPSLIPNLLLNGAKGIASGFATEMPPHNLGEILDGAVAKILKPEISLEALMKIIKGPDFPTGGQVFGTDGVYEAFKTGRGKVILVSKYRITEDKKHKYIEIYEIPYGVVKSKLVKDIDLITLTSEIPGIVEIKDQSDRSGISILITLEKDANVETIINFLLQKTELQIYYNYNNVVIQNNSPKLLNLLELLDEYIGHIKNVKTKTLKYDLVKYKLRLEIVEGFIKVSEITDEIIEVIRKSENSKAGVIENLMKVFAFTQNQATAIAELRLYKLSKTDKEAFLREKVELETNIAQCELLLNDSNAFNKWLIELLKTIKKEYALPRKTDVHSEKLDKSYNESDLIKEEDVIVAVTNYGYLKRYTEKNIAQNQWTTYGLKTEDKLVFHGKTSTLAHLLIFTNLGNYAIVPVFKLDDTKWKENGMHLSQFVELKTGETVVGAFAIKNFAENLYVSLFSKQAQGMRILLKDLEVSRFNKTFAIFKLEQDDEVIGARLSNGWKDFLLISKNGLAWQYSENEISVRSGKSIGIKAAKLAKDDFLVAFTVLGDSDQIALLTDTKIKNLKIKDKFKTNKTNVGKKIFEQLKFNEILVRDCLTIDSATEILLKNDNNELILDYPTNYKVSASVSEPFENFSAPRIVLSCFKTDYFANQNLDVVTHYEEKSVAEEQIFKKAEQEVNAFDMDIDALLKKLNIE
ncbi:DNA topoisomerase IV subunit A [Mycoplasmopsis columbinasalis]|uniref:DNA topoisomerase (ATP-hydrolyzing) n=1 Tax=Mycoplasmopsis columbinasalis TaxID=114880 RepID=A0A449BAI1_9BACT|nr:DNA topoisomerase IV subunit A [Mycoplasmopsis columbinasalis]VEU78205.1 DNA gyrase subunit A [Mycoplasmopsis columbinasalis]